MAKEMSRINLAIWTVVNTKAKKNCKDAVKEVEAAGYVISKDGHKGMTVSNPRTKRFVYVDYNWRNIEYINYGWYAGQRRQLTAEFDFVGCLEKPYNTEYHNFHDDRSKAYQKYDILQRAKRDVDYEARQIAECEKQLKQLQARLMSATEAKVRDEFKLAEVRKELGLA